MRVAVTGASGFVGGRVVAALVEAGHDVLAFSRRPVAPRDGLEWRPWDLVTGPLVDPPPVEAVVHAAAHVDDWDPWPVLARATVAGTLAVLDTWPRARLVLVSSASVYPLRASGQTFHEAVPVTRRPLSPYVVAKIEQERIVLSRKGSLVLRPHAVHGPGDTTLLPRLSRARRHGRLVCPGGRDTLVHVTDVDLLALAVVRACERAEVSGLLNVADAKPLPLADLVTGLVAANGWPERPLFTGSWAAWAAAGLLEGTGRLRRASAPPLLTAYGVSHVAVSRTFDTTRLRARLGVEPWPTDVSQWRAGGTSSAE